MANSMFLELAVGRINALERTGRHNKYFLCRHRGRYQLCRMWRGEIKDVSPKLPLDQLYTWLWAYIEGFEAGWQARGEERI